MKTLDDEFKKANRIAGRLLKEWGVKPAPRRPAKRRTKTESVETVAQALARITPNWKSKGRE